MRKPIFKKTIATAVMLSLLAQYSGMAFADPSAAFSRLMNGASTSVSKPGYYASQAEHVYSGGSFDFHAPAESTQLISVTPPTISAGCGGIDLNLGGFNIISGANFAAFIQAAAQSAEGYVIMIGIKALCPQCAAVLSEIHQLAEDAAKSSQNSCQAGQWAVDHALSLMGSNAANSDGVQQSCGQAATAGSAADNPLDAIAGDACSLLSSAATTLGSLIPKESPAEQAAKPIFGNFGWIALSSLGMDSVSEMEFILSMTGTVSHTQDKTVTQNGTGGSTGGVTTTYYPPTLSMSGKDAKEAIELLMCGTTGANSPDTTVAEYCQKHLPPNSVPTFWICADENPDPRNPKACQQMTFGETPNSVSYSFGQTPIGASGFLLYVHALLSNAITAILSNTEIDQRFIALANVSPIPIYKIVDIAAVYPAVAQNLVDNSSLLIAELLTQAYLRQILNYGARTFTSTASTGPVHVANGGEVPLPASATAAFDSTNLGLNSTAYADSTGTPAFNFNALINGINQSGFSLIPPANYSGMEDPYTGGAPAQDPGQAFIDSLVDTNGSVDQSPNSDVAPSVSGSTTEPFDTQAGNGSPSSGAAVNEKLAQQMQDMLQALDAQTMKTTEEFKNLSTLQQQLLAQIRDIDQVIQTQVMQQGLAGNDWASSRILHPGGAAGGGVSQPASGSTTPAGTTLNTTY